MAAADYRLCDVCSSKAFYDSNLNYDFPEKPDHDLTSHRFPAVRIAGANQHDAPEKSLKWGYRLDYIGDWAVVCNDCSPKFFTAILSAEEHAALIEQRKART